MQILNVTTHASDLDECEQFYAHILGLPAAYTSDRAAVEVQVGSTTLRFEREESQDAGFDHLAFEVPAAKFAEAKSWLTQRVPLLLLNGEDEIEGPPGWNSRSVYFSGPSGSVLELIARRDRDHAATGPFTSADLLNVSEVGLAVPDVIATAQAAEDAGVRPFAAPPAPAFAPVGDPDGLLILVQPGRPWLPTTDRPSGQRRISVVARGATPAVFEAGAATVRLVG